MGHLLLEDQNLKAEKITDADRNGVIMDFCSMVIAASKAHDMLHATTTVYDTDGAMLRLMEGWEVFRDKSYGKDVTQRTYQQMFDMFMANPNLGCVGDAKEFWGYEGNKGEAGFRIPGIGHDIIVDKPTWRQWRKAWFLIHPDDIDWSQASDPNRFFVNIDCINETLETQIKQHLATELKLSKDDDLVLSAYNDKLQKDVSFHVDEKLSNRLKPNCVALLFHKYVMGAKARGGERQGYAKELADDICAANYYHEAPDMAAMEKDAAPKGRNEVQRAVYYIKRPDGTYRFISIDFEKGMYEFHYDDGSHLGEYYFDGSQNEKADDTGGHNLRCVRNWKAKHHI